MSEIYEGVFEEEEIEEMTQNPKAEWNQDTQKAVVVVSARNSGIMPVMPVANAVQRFAQLKNFASEVMVKDVDYGIIPGTSKPALYKAGAEKLTTFFGLSPTFEIIKSIERWDEDPLFYYMTRCTLRSGDVVIATADGSCNSREKRYAWRWVPEHQVPAHLPLDSLEQGGGKISEFAFAVDKAETTGQYGKSAEYWQKFTDAIANGTARKFMKGTRGGKEYEAWEIDGTTYRIPNPDIFDLVNTILKMSEKRSLVAVVLIGANASEFFTQDVEDAGGADEGPVVNIIEATKAAKMAVGLLACAHGLIEDLDDTDGKNAMLVAAGEKGLTKDNMLERFSDWMKWIQGHEIVAEED